MSDDASKKRDSKTPMREYQSQLSDLDENFRLPPGEYDVTPNHVSVININDYETTDDRAPMVPPKMENLDMTPVTPDPGHVNPILANRMSTEGTPFAYDHVISEDTKFITKIVLE